MRFPFCCDFAKCLNTNGFSRTIHIRILKTTNQAEKGRKIGTASLVSSFIVSHKMALQILIVKIFKLMGFLFGINEDNVEVILLSICFCSSSRKEK